MPEMTAARRGKYEGRVYADGGDQFRRHRRHMYGPHEKAKSWPRVAVGHPNSVEGEHLEKVHPAILRQRAQINWHAYLQARR